MLLFKKPFHAGLTSGEITLTFRRWQKAHVRQGGRYRCHPIGVLLVDAVSLVTTKSVTASDAKRAGFDSRVALIDYLLELGPLDETTEIWRVELRHVGDGDRVEFAMVDALTEADIAAIRARLASFDARVRWTKKTLAIISEHPRVAASQLAKKLKRETLELKVDIRKLKKLGLTQSFEVGYEISPRGRAYLDCVNTERVNKTRAKRR